MKPKLKLIFSVGLALSCLAIGTLFFWTYNHSDLNPASNKIMYVGILPNAGSVPAGNDAASRASISSSSDSLAIQTVSEVTHHTKKYENQTVRVEGYVLKIEKDYAIFSDEPSGLISTFDLPVTGEGTEALEEQVKYQIEGKLIFGGLKSSNKSEYHVEVTRIEAK